jgi:hypothetical protein
MKAYDPDDLQLASITPEGVQTRSAPWYTIHADFWNTWQQPIHEQMVQTCIVDAQPCSKSGI